MPQVSVALAAQHLGAIHEEAVVGFLLHVLLRGRRIETRPPAAGIELFVAAKHRRPAAHARVRAVLVMVPILPRERALGPLLARHREFLRRQLLTPFRFGLFDLGHLPIIQRAAGLTFQRHSP